MASAKRKKNQSGSAQVGDWKFTYQDRIRSFQNVGLAEGDAALSDYAQLFGRVERILFAQFSAGVSLTSLKNSFLIKYRIPARMLNSLRVSLEGKISAVRESMNRHIESLTTRIKRAKAQITAAIERSNLNAAHQKKRRLAILAGRLASVLYDKASGRVRLCFGFRKLWRSSITWRPTATPALTNGERTGVLPAAMSSSSWGVRMKPLVDSCAWPRFRMMAASL